MWPSECSHGLPSHANRSATVLDARPRAEYAVSHVPGALNVAAKPGLPAHAYVSDVAEVGRLVQERKEMPLVLISRSVTSSTAPEAEISAGSAKGYRGSERRSSKVPLS